MRFGIKYKLFVILLSASLLIITCMFVFTRVSFKQGLIRYMDTMQEQHLETMCQILAENYALQGDWDFLADNPEGWDMMQRYAFRKWRKMSRPSHMRPGHMGEPGVTGEGYRRGEREDRHPRLILLDKSRNTVFGQKDHATPLRLMPVVIDGEPVGYLGISHSPSLIQSEELRFFERQTRVFLMIALGMVLLSILVAVWTAYFLEGPITVLTRGTRSLASGDYRTRIPVTSRDELGRLSEDFNALAATLEQNETDRKKWVEDIAHELRTPLTLLSGELEALEDGVRELTPMTIKQLQADICHLIRLVNDLNELSRTDKGALTYKKIETDLVSLIITVTDRYAEALSRQGIQLDGVDAPQGQLFTVFADPERLKQLFGNILQNSLDYTQPGGHIRIGLERQGSHVRVRVDDSNPGVPSESLNRLFDRLYRVEGSRNRRFGGSGLGLSICKNIVDAHGGSMIASHSPMGGLRLQIDLPLWTGEPI